MTLPKIRHVFAGLFLLATTFLLISCFGRNVIPSTPAAQGVSVKITPLPRAVIADQTKLASLSPNRLSANFVDRTMHDLPVDQHLALFRSMDPDALDAALNTQDKQLAFWLNLYNGYTQYLLKRDPSLFLNDRPSHFGSDQVDVAGYRVALEEIEHGVMRRGATIYTLGHVRLLFIRSAFVRKFAVDKVDYRIHFALNCGALSCPPVVPYTAEEADAQLDATTRFYLREEVQFDAAENIVRVPALMRWFSADFGGSAGAKRAILQRYGVIPANAEPNIAYLDYDWTLAVENYAVYRAP